jgi:energy-coupling factor transporter ATP-binding protein EcfA2
MTALAMPDLTVLVMAAGETPQEQGYARGHLFEQFVAKLLNRYSFEEPRSSNINVTSDGIEIDVVAHHNLTRAKSIAECKAYTRPVKANELTNFYGKLAAERLEQPDTFGLMVALPRLTPEGEEKARAIVARDSNFRYLNADDIAGAMRDLGMIVDEPSGLEHTSDPALIITSDGEYAATVLLDERTRKPISVAVWAASGSVPEPTINLIRSSDYAPGVPVFDVRAPSESTARSSADDSHGRSQEEPLIAAVMGSTSDFEYQLPTSPRYFVGRKTLLARVSARLDSGEKVVVFNAQSGWGKSSLALKLADIATDRGGYALVLDTRTAGNARYIVEVVRRAATEAERYGLLSLPEDSTWATLTSSLRTLNRASWVTTNQPLLVFFDQFENVFRDPELTRSFRDLAAGVRELTVPFMVGFAWKTDLVGWTENHPYQLRDEIRQMGTVFVVDPFGATEVSTLLGRLEKQVGTRLVPDLRSRLREYSQGLPWLLKKLSDHVLRELGDGVTQEQLLAEALNVQNLFQADLAELSPGEHEVLHHIARFAPIAASEVTERYTPDLVQSLVNRRLIVQVGERLDTYWDTFRDFLNTGRVPVEDSYILRQSPHQASRLLPLVVAAGGDAGVRELAQELETSDTAIFNTSRDLRLLGMTAHEPNRVRLVEEVWLAPDRERALRRRVAFALRRHRALSTFMSLSERSSGRVSIAAYGRELPKVFPAVEVSAHTWSTYARAILSWMSYAGLVVQQGNDFSPAPDGYENTNIRLLDVRSPLRVRIAVPHEPPRAALELISRLGRGEIIELSSYPSKRGFDRRDALRTVVGIGAGVVEPDGRLRLTRTDLAENGLINPTVLRELLATLPGGAAGLALLERIPEATPAEVGEVIRKAAGASWRPATVQSVGTYWRGWARAAGLELRPVPRRSIRQDELLSP